MSAQFLAHIFKILNKWLSRLARRSISLLFSFLSSLRRLAAGCSNLRHRGWVTGSRLSLGALMRGNVAGDGVPIFPSRLPSGQSPSDDPYLRIPSRPHSRQGLEIPSRSVSESNPFSSSTASSLHPPRHRAESESIPPSPRIPYDQKGKGIDSSERGCAETLSIQTSRSTAPSLVVPEGRQSEYRRHVGPGHLPGSVHNSVADLRASLYSVSADLPNKAVPISDIARAHLIAPPGSDGQPGSEVATLYDAPRVRELIPEGIKRYERETRASKDSETIIPAVTTTFPAHDMLLPDEWISVVHPEGSRYFMNRRQRTFTESNICDSELHKQIEYGTEVLLDLLKSEKLDMNAVDLVIEPKVDVDHNIVFWYYFVNHESRCIFWLDNFDAEDVLSDCQGVRSLSHKGLAIQAQYWRHWDYFPSLCPVSQDLVDEVNDMLMHAKCDHLSSKQSSAPYDITGITDYISVVDRIKVLPEDQGVTRRCHAAIVIGRIMYEFSRNAFINFHGEDCARLSFDQTVHGWKYKPSLWMVIFTPMLFLEPVIYVQELHKIFADKIACTSRWNAFSSRLKGQLQNSNLLATVLLSANVAFLGVIKGGSFIQMTSYMSLVTSFGSIVLGLFFVSQDRTSGESTAGEAASFLSTLHHERHGLESLAMIYSFPKALLMWGMVFFFVAFSMNWYTSGAIAPELVVVGVVTLFVFVMIAVSIMRTKERHHWWPMTRDLLSDLGNTLKRVMGIIRARRDDDISLTRIGRPEINAAVDNPRASSSNLLGQGYSLHIQEGTWTAPEVQRVGEARYEPEPDHASLVVNEPLHFIPTKAVIPSDHDQQTMAVLTDSGAAVSEPDPLRAEEREGLEHIKNNQENNVPRVRESTASPPIILARGATGETFYPAPSAVKRTRSKRP